MSDWIHCNKCGTMPSVDQKCTFWFTSCGHIICNSCAGKVESSQRRACNVCSKESGFVAINRHMRPDLLELFKPPELLLKNFAQKVIATIEFQTYQRERLSTHQQTMYKKAMEQIHAMQQEHSKHATLERALLEEKEHLRTALEQEKGRVVDLTSRLDTTSQTLVNSSSYNSAISTPRNFNEHAARPSHHSSRSRQESSPAFSFGHHHGIRRRQLKPVVCASYTANFTRSVSGNPAFHRENNNFLSPAASFLNRSLHTPFPAGRITKGHVLPPSLGIQHRHGRH